MKFLINGSDYLSQDPSFKLVGRDKELENISSVLIRSMANSILLVGPGGVGCTALIMGLQASKSNPNAPFDIVSKRFSWLDCDELFSSGDNKVINDSFKSVMTELIRTPNSVLVIEDTKDFIDGARNNNCGHFINAIITAIKNKSIQCILESRDDDLDTVLKAHSDFKEAFTLIDVEEPINSALKEIAVSASKGLTKHHGIEITEDAIDTALKLTTRYRTKDQSLNRAQPERTINLLDRALSTYRLTAHKDVPVETQDKLKTLYKQQRDGEGAILGLEEELQTQKKREEDAKEAGESIQKHKIDDFKAFAARGGFESQAIQEIRGKIASIQTAVNQNRGEFEKITSELNAVLKLDANLVLAEFSRISGISADKLSENEVEKLKTLDVRIKKRIYGQDAIVGKVVDAIKVARLGRRTNKPTAFLFLGPSGVGKTEISKALAEALFDDENTLARFDMSEYMEKHAVAKMIGAPPGYEGFEVGGILTNLARKNSRRVFLFDEIEKAHPDVFNIFLQVLSDGRLTDGIGRTAYFDNESLLIFTTNIGQNHFLENEDFEIAKVHAMEELASTYRAEFLNRFAGRENIVCFNKLGLDSMEMIVNREINNLNSEYMTKGIEILIHDQDLKQFCKEQYDPKIGARGLPGYIQANLEPVIVNAILDNSKISATLEVEYDLDNRKLVTHLEDKIPAPEGKQGDPSPPGTDFLDDKR